MSDDCTSCGQGYTSEAPRFRCGFCKEPLCYDCLRRGAAFTCEGCGKTCCAKHRKAIHECHYCPACYVPALEAALEASEADLAAAKREVKAYEEACERIAALTGGPGKRWAVSLGTAQSIATMAPFMAKSAALSAA